MEEVAELRHDGDVRSLSFTPNGSMLAGGGGNDDFKGLISKKGAGNAMKTVVWQVSSDTKFCKCLGSILFDDIVHAVAFSPSGKLLAVGGEDARITMLLVDRAFEKTS